MSDVRAQPLRPGTPAFHAACVWARAHPDRALLFLADVCEPLSRHARFFSASCAGEVCGVAVRCAAFSPVTLTCAARDAASREALLMAARAVEHTQPLILITHEAQVLPEAVRALACTQDLWWTQACARTPPGREVCALTDEAELGPFHAAQAMHHHHPDMLQLGHHFGARDAGGELVCAGGVQFMLPDRSYAQLGGLVTAAHARGCGHASRVLAAIRSSLADAGVTMCGLFADAEDPILRGFYAKRGFQPRARFAFRELS